MSKHFFLMTLAILLLGNGCVHKYNSAGLLHQTVPLEKSLFFDWEFRQPDADFSKYETVQVKPISLEYLKNRNRYAADDLRTLKIRFKEELQEALLPSLRILADNASADYKTLVAVFALTSISQPKQGVALWLSKLTFQSKFIGTDGFEAKFLDGETGEVVAQIASGPLKAEEEPEFNGFIPYTVYHATEENFKAWSSKLSKWLSSYD